MKNCFIFYFILYFYSFFNDTLNLDAFEFNFKAKACARLALRLCSHTTLWWCTGYFERICARKTRRIISASVTRLPQRTLLTTKKKNQLYDLHYHYCRDIYYNIHGLTCFMYLKTVIKHFVTRE